MSSRRINNLREQLIKELPKDGPSKKSLESKSLTELLVSYLNWATRKVKIRARKLIVSDLAIQDTKWSSIKESDLFKTLEQKISNGEDINEYLSRRVDTHGYSVKADEGDSWADKDFILNIMGYHHLHLKPFEKGVPHNRTNDLIFVKITKENLEVVGVFDHSVFDENDEMNEERSNLWLRYDEHSSLGLEKGFYIMNPIMTSGHTDEVVQAAIEYTQVINEVDTKLDDRDFTNETFYTEISPPNKLKSLSWYLDCTELGIYDKENKCRFILRHGKN